MPTISSKERLRQKLNRRYPNVIECTATSDGLITHPQSAGRELLNKLDSDAFPGNGLRGDHRDDAAYQLLHATLKELDRRFEGITPKFRYYNRGNQTEPVNQLDRWYVNRANELETKISFVRRLMFVFEYRVQLDNTPAWSESLSMNEARYNYLCGRNSPADLDVRVSRFIDELPCSEKEGMVWWPEKPMPPRN